MIRALSVLCLVGLLSDVLPAQSPFEQPRLAELSTWDWDIALGDVDNDGHRDVVLCKSSVTVLLGDGAGGFEPLPFLLFGLLDARDPTLRDLNGDGYLDLTVIQSPFDQLVVLLNDGDGSFTLDGTYDLGADPVDSTLLDVDGDGQLDALVTTAAPWRLSLLLGAGDGSFQPALDLGPTSTQLQKLAEGDLDGDGDSDLVATSSVSDSITVFQNNGSVALLAETVYSTGAGDVLNGRPLLTDVDADGTLDVVVPASPPVLFLGLGDGTLGAPQPLPSSGGTLRIRSGDVDNDGHLDLLLAVTGNAFELLLGHGDGSFDPPLAQGTLGIIRDLALLDANADGDLDLLTANDDSLMLQRGHGDGRFGHFFPTPASAPVVVTVTDLDGDGEADVLAAGESGLSVLFGGEAALFEPGPSTTALDTITAVVSGDLDADGDPDVILCGRYGNTQVTRLENLGGGVLGPPLDLGGSGQVMDAELADVDVDGTLDLLVARWGNDKLGTYLGQGDSTFGPPTSTSMGDKPLDLAAGDFDGDGLPDAAVVHENSGDSLRIALGLGDGTFKAGDSTDLGLCLGDVETADLNLDGQLDLVVSGTPAGLLVLSGLGDGSFAAPVSHAAASSWHGVAIGDLDRDGWPDVVMAWDDKFSDGGALSVRHGSAAGLSEAQSVATASNTPDVALADVDGDGALDAVVASRGDQLIEVLRGQAGAWSALGFGLEGSQGIPRQRITGTLSAGAPFEVSLEDARPSGACFWVVGLSQLAVPFKAGVLVPSPDVVVGGLPIDTDGTLTFGGSTPALPAGLSLWFQFWLPDPTGPVGFAASNAILGLTY